MAARHSRDEDAGNRRGDRCSGVGSVVGQEHILIGSPDKRYYANLLVGSGPNDRKNDAHTDAELHTVPILIPDSR